MNSYILIFRNKMLPKKWLKIFFISSFILALCIFTMNYIVDPYNLTKYNILDIKYKFARDDRSTKVNFFKTKSNMDNILIGSSRVYSINPKTVTNVVGGTTYNFGVGTATVEDHLGIIKYLQRENKLPKRLIIGVDFYTFNKDHPLNKYFLKNKELNFLSYSQNNSNSLEDFFSLDVTIASYKTLKYHIRKKKKKPRFDENGWGGYKKGYLDYSKIDIDKELLKVKEEMNDIEDRYYSMYEYNTLDEKRKRYYLEIKEICKENDIELILFSTPLHPLLLKKLDSNTNTRKALSEFVEFFSSFDNFKHMYDNKELYADERHFNGATHTTVNGGDIIIKSILLR